MRCAAVILLWLLLAGAAAAAQESQRAPPEAAGAAATMTAVARAPAVAAERASFWAAGLTWMLYQQRRFYQRLAQALRDTRAHDSVETIWALLAVSFLYGIFHAAGPGHGKGVLTAYLLSHGPHWSRGVWIAAAAAICQACTAIVLVYGLIMVAGWTMRDTSSIISSVERLSFGLVAALGALLAARALGALYRGWRNYRRPVDSGLRNNRHDGCGHAHFHPAEGTFSLRAALGVAASIGMRPCSGSVLVLTFALVLKLPWVGVAAVLVMAAGTALAVATLALLAVNARNLAVRVVSRDGRAFVMATNLVAVLGGAAIFWIGLTLLEFSPASGGPLRF